MNPLLQLHKQEHEKLSVMESQLSKIRQEASQWQVNTGGIPEPLAQRHDNLMMQAGKLQDKLIIADRTMEKYQSVMASMEDKVERIKETMKKFTIPDPTDGKEWKMVFPSLQRDPPVRGK